MITETTMEVRVSRQPRQCAICTVKGQGMAVITPVSSIPMCVECAALLKEKLQQFEFHADF